MASELETQIMFEIQLGNDYRFFNGSGSCASIRRSATDKLAAAIQAHHDAGDDIAPPDTSLIDYCKEVARYGEQNDHVLTNTFQVCSYVIAAHWHHATASPGRRADAFKRLKTFLEEHYPIKRDWPNAKSDYFIGTKY